VDVAGIYRSYQDNWARVDINGIYPSGPNQPFGGFGAVDPNRGIIFQQQNNSWSTLEYRARLGQSQAIFRVEHRYDHSTGSGGGFFEDIQPGVVGLTPGQHLLAFAGILAFDASSRR
jgi:hypothetical protein